VRRKGLLSPGVRIRFASKERGIVLAMLACKVMSMAGLRSVCVASVLLVSATAFAGCAAPAEEEDTDGEASADALTGTTVREAEGRVEGCFSVNWAQAGFRYEASSKYKPDSNWLAWGYSQAVELLNERGEQMGALLLRNSAGNQLLNKLEGRLKTLSRDQQLLPFQKAYAAQCVSSRLFKYSHSAVSRVFGSAAAAEYEAGVCTEYTKVAARLLNAIGIWADYQGSYDAKHAFVEVWFSNDRTYYYIEPQHDPSEGWSVFYNKH
jgi:hypothetical protein